MTIGRHDYTRLEAFSDAIIAFAAVRLILSLDVPKNYADLVANVTGFIPFAITFGALLLMWVAHRNLFRRYPLDDAFTLVVNGLFLFTIVFYAFPLKFIATSVVALIDPGSRSIAESSEQLQMLFTIYGLGWMTIFFCIALLYLHAALEWEALGLSEIETYDAVSDGMFYLGVAAGGALSVALAYLDVGVDIGLPVLAYCLIGVFVAISTITRRRRRPDEIGAALAPAATSSELIPDIPDD